MITDEFDAKKLSAWEKPKIVDVENYPFEGNKVFSALIIALPISLMIWGLLAAISYFVFKLWYAPGV